MMRGPVSTKSNTPSWSPLVRVLGLAGLVVMADNGVVSPLLPSIARTLSTSVTQTGILIAVYMLPFGLFQLAFGPIADRFGKLRTVTVTLAMFGVVTALGGFMASLTGLVAVRAVTGIFAASTMPVSLALIGDVVPMQHRQQAIDTFSRHLLPRAGPQHGRRGYHRRARRPALGVPRLTASSLSRWSGCWSREGRVCPIRRWRRTGRS